MWHRQVTSWLGKGHATSGWGFVRILGPVLKFWTLRKFLWCESWAGQDPGSCSNSSVYFSPLGRCFLVPGREKPDFFIIFFFPLLIWKKRGRTGLCGRKPGQERKAWYVSWYKTTKGNPLQWQQSCLSVTVLLCLSPLVIKIFSHSLQSEWKWIFPFLHVFSAELWFCHIGVLDGISLRSICV